jgi:hypothetical protein
MIRSFKRMQGMPIKVLDGEIGKLKDVYFDDKNWTVQYFVVELGSWFLGKDVLVPPSTIAPFDGTSLRVQLTKDELQACPHADSDTDHGAGVAAMGMATVSADYFPT